MASRVQRPDAALLPAGHALLQHCARDYDDGDSNIGVAATSQATRYDELKYATITLHKYFRIYCRLFLSKIFTFTFAECTVYDFHSTRQSPSSLNLT